MHVGVSGGCHSGARGSLIMGCRWEVLRSQRQASDTGQCQNELVSHYKDVRASMYLPQRCYFRVTLIAGRPEGVRFSRPPPPPFFVVPAERRLFSTIRHFVIRFLYLPDFLTGPQGVVASKPATVLHNAGRYVHTHTPARPHLAPQSVFSTPLPICTNDFSFKH